MCILFYFILFYNLCFSFYVDLYAEYARLIDFSSYEDYVRSSEGIFDDFDSQNNLRNSFFFDRDELDFFNTNENLNYKTFKLTYQDMLLDKWKIIYHYTNFKEFFKANLASVEEIKFLKQDSKIKALKASLFFSKSPFSSYAILKPPFGIIPYDSEGNICSVGHGVIHNILKIKFIRLRVGVRIGDIQDLSFTLNLEGRNFSVSSYRLGNLYEGEFAYRFYRKYDGESFDKDDLLDINTYDKDKQTENLTLYYDQYFKVAYKDDKVMYFSFYSDGKEIYREYFLYWYNSEYLPLQSRDLYYQKPFSLNALPFLRFHSLVINSLDGNMGGNVDILIRDIYIDYDKSFPDINFDLDYDNFDIIKNKNREYRLLLDLKYGLEISEILKKGINLGFYSYDDFRKVYLDDNVIDFVN